jgi:hypothetical protein
MWLWVSSMASDSVATVCWILGYPDQAWRYAERLVELLRAVRPPTRLCCWHTPSVEDALRLFA